jgi:hypothetical protein
MPESRGNLMVENIRLRECPIVAEVGAMTKAKCIS